MKTAITFSSNDLYDIRARINEFLSDDYIKVISMSAYATWNPVGGTFHYVIIIYEDENPGQ